MGNFVTSIVLVSLVSLFVSEGARRDLEAGRLGATGEPLAAGRVLSRLPAR
ncbi:hypothetical protein [Streptomyces sp. NPDC001292]|uniref:hypothetical protein n=1 Tax=Streptomyces sp. NPDC001292 TaxID=3364558 RepID=UPI00367E9FEC